MQDYKTTRCIGCLWWDDKNGCSCQDWNLRWQCIISTRTKLNGRTISAMLKGGKGIMRKEDIKVLIACEESQAVCIEMRKRGYEAFSCDIIECSGGHPEWHLKQDVIPLLKLNWDMIIAFPPCTYLSNAGARHLYKGGRLNIERYEKGLKAKEFFLKIWNSDCPRIAIENPTPSRIYELPEKTQVIQPYYFGHPFTKRTQLWLKGLPMLKPTNIVEPERTWCPSGSYSGKHDEKYRGIFTTDRAKNRSKTFPGIARAMAEQWGAVIEGE